MNITELNESKNRIVLATKNIYNVASQILVLHYNNYHEYLNMLLEIEENYYRQLAQNVNDIEDLQIIMLQTEFNKTPFKNSPDSAFDNDFDYVKYTNNE